MTADVWLLYLDSEASWLEGRTGVFLWCVISWFDFCETWIQEIILGLHVTLSFSKIQKLLSSSGMRGAKFISVNDFSAQKDAWSKNRHILNFMSYMYGSAWHKAMDMFVEKYILISRFSAFLEVKVLGKVLIWMFSWLVQTNIWSLGKRTDLKLGELSLIFIHLL